MVCLVSSVGGAAGDISAGSSGLATLFSPRVGGVAAGSGDNGGDFRWSGLGIGAGFSEE